MSESNFISLLFLAAVIIGVFWGLIERAYS